MMDWIMLGVVLMAVVVILFLVPTPARKREAEIIRKLTDRDN